MRPGRSQVNIRVYGSRELSVKYAELAKSCEFSGFEAQATNFFHTFAELGRTLTKGTLHNLRTNNNVQEAAASLYDFSCLSRIREGHDFKRAEPGHLLQGH
jgi:hypothetical protein